MSNTKHTILVAEDNEVTRQLITKLMEKEGFRVVQAVDGSTAKTVVNREKVSLGLVDLHMAPEGGFEFADYVEDHKLNIPIILVTGDQGMDLLLEVRKHKIAQVVQKPVEPERLKTVVQRVLKKHYPEDFQG